MTEPRIRWLKLCLLLALGIPVVLGVILWLILWHSTPSFAIVDFYIPTSNSYNTNSKANIDGPDVSFVLEIKNPNIIYSIVYDYILLTISFKEGMLAQKDISGFSQAKYKKESIPIHMEAIVQQWKALIRSISNSSRKPKLKVKLETGIRYKAMGHTGKQHHLKLQGQFKIRSDGKVSGNRKIKLCKSNNCDPVKTKRPTSSHAKKRKKVQQEIQYAVGKHGIHT